MTTPLTVPQRRAVEATGFTLLTGPAGTGKTTALHRRLLRLLQSGEPAYTILVLLPDKTHIDKIGRFLQQSDTTAYGDLQTNDYHNLARAMVTLFWPIVARDAGFASGAEPPHFLGYDLAQLLMWQTVMPMFEAGAFSGLHLRPQRIVSQLLDTLNRAALNQLDMAEATARQIDTWSGDSDHLRHVEQAQLAAADFRQHCLDNNLLDLSLTVATFDRYVLSNPEFSRYFQERFRHLLVDNLEEQTPAGQSFVEQLMHSTQSTTLAYDEGGGYRRFLAADPLGSLRFRTRVETTIAFEQPLLAPQSLQALGQRVSAAVQGANTLPSVDESATALLDVIHTRYRRDMVIALAERLVQLVHEDGIDTQDIAIICPYLDGALRYQLLQACRQVGLPTNIMRRRATPRDEPRVRAWLTWVALAHPQWGVSPQPFDVAEALTLSLADINPGQAAMLADHLYQTFPPLLLPAADLPVAIDDHFSAEMLSQYETLRLWLAEYGDAYRLDMFIYQLFADLLATPAFQPEPDVAGAAVCDWLVTSAERLVQTAPRLGLNSSAEIGRAFLDSINRGLVNSQPPDTGNPPDPSGISISTIYGYLLSGRDTRVQIWLDTAATGWWDIPRQPLSNAFVLAQNWEPEQLWTMQDEIEIRNELLTRVVHGLVNRCRDGIILATSDLDRRGQIQDGTLWRALQANVHARQAGS